ncbi:MAG: hypothetical protein MUF42_01880 [Cytophagaceae bacterium]|jgi:hypothetical protein|nr:hypothetical protein [Cytophagaceae bacterium]
MYKKLCLGACTALLVLVACEEKKKSSGTADTIVDTVNAVSDTIVVPEAQQPAAGVEIKDWSFDQTVSLLSGVKQKSGSPLASNDTSAAWKSFAQDFDSTWSEIEKKRFSKMRTWGKTELASANDDATPVFYPFSGPDILNAFVFFPKAKSYTLLALEPVGDLPDFANMNAKQKQDYYLSVRSSLNDLFKKSYFITKNMLADLQKHKVNGALPLITLFLKRTGNTIVKVQYISLDSTGAIVEKTKDEKYSNRGVRVDFIPAGEKEIRSVYYFKVDLEDRGLKANPAFTKFLAALPTVHSYLKSASYLLHYPEFTTVRNTIFDKSDCILQDDSGIAFHYFDKKKWKIQLYGAYAKPVADFPHIKEPDLQKAYSDSSSVKTLPFELGYHWGTRKQNMLKAERF